MPDDVAPVEVGFSDFTAKLITDVFDAVIDAQLDQEHRLTELAAAAELSLRDFAERIVSDEQVGDELARLFPGESPDHPTAIRVGAPYEPGTDDEGEQPPVHELLGLRLSRRDYARRGQRTTLNARGVDRVASGVRELLALERHEGVRAMVRRGLPRVVAESGRIRSKLTYQVHEIEDTTDDPGTTPGPPFPPTRGRAALPEPASLAKLRLVVRPADERAPQNQALRVDVFGEVELTFRMIT